MVPAKQDQVVDGRCASVDPVNDVMCVAPPAGAVTAREHAAKVAGEEGDAHGGGDEALGPPHIQRLTLGVEDDPGHT